MIHIIAGARPNFVKIARIMMAMKWKRIPYELVHTGQHYDYDMSQVFFDQLGIPEPDFYLGVGSGGHGEQTGRVMIEYEKLAKERKPSMIIVVGDVNSTLAAALVGSKLHIPVVHVEAGLRSRDRNMPEEINRVLTDRISDLLFVTEEAGMANLRAEGIDMERCHLVGNVMIDTLGQHLEEALALELWQEFGMERGEYCLFTAPCPQGIHTPTPLGRHGKREDCCDHKRFSHIEFTRYCGKKASGRPLN